MPFLKDGETFPRSLAAAFNKFAKAPCDNEVDTCDKDDRTGGDPPPPPALTPHTRSAPPVAPRGPRQADEPSEDDVADADAVAPRCPAARQFAPKRILKIFEDALKGSVAAPPTIAELTEDYAARGARPPAHIKGPSSRG